MHPDVISIGPFTLHAYGVMMAIGFLAGLGNWILLARREGRSAQFCTDLMFWVMIAGIVGARIAYIMENGAYYVDHPAEILRVDQGGLIFYGGFVGSAIAIVIFAKRRAEALTGLFDFVVTSVPLAHAFGRVGCFLNGCCFGHCTSWPIQVRFPMHSIPWFHQVREHMIEETTGCSLPVHPVQLYEAGFNLCVYGILLYLFRRRLRSGMVTAIYLMLYAIGRFSLEFLRGDRVDRAAVSLFSIGQFVSLLVFAAGVAIMIAILWASQGKDKNA